MISDYRKITQVKYLCSENSLGQISGQVSSREIG